MRRDQSVQPIRNLGTKEAGMRARLIPCTPIATGGKPPTKRPRSKDRVTASGHFIPQPLGDLARKHRSSSRQQVRAIGVYVTIESGATA